MAVSGPSMRACTSFSSNLSRVYWFCCSIMVRICSFVNTPTPWAPVTTHGSQESSAQVFASWSLIACQYRFSNCTSSVVVTSFCMASGFSFARKIHADRRTRSAAFSIDPAPDARCLGRGSPASGAGCYFPTFGGNLPVHENRNPTVVSPGHLRADADPGRMQDAVDPDHREQGLVLPDLSWLYEAHDPSGVHGSRRRSHSPSSCLRHGRQHRARLRAG